MFCGAHANFPLDECLITEQQVVETFDTPFPDERNHLAHFKSHAQSHLPLATVSVACCVVVPFASGTFGVGGADA